MVRTAPVERSPARLSGGIAGGAGVLALVASASSSPTGGAVALAGLAVLVSGLVVGTRRVVSVGAAGLLAGVLLAGVAGAPRAVLLVAVGATVVAWDVGGVAIDLGAQLGREANTRRVEAVHAATSVAVAAAVAGVGYGIYATAAGGQPVAALLALLVAGLLLLSALDYS